MRAAVLVGTGASRIDRAQLGSGVVGAGAVAALVGVEAGALGAEEDAAMEVVGAGLGGDLDLGAGEAAVFGVVVVGDDLDVADGVFGRGDERGAAPDGGDGGDAVDGDAVGLVLAAVGVGLGTILGGKMPLAGAAGTLGAGELAGAAAGGLGAIAEDAGGELDELEDVAAGRGEVLDLVGVDVAGDGGGVGVEGGKGSPCTVDGGVGAADGELDVDGVGLFGIDDDVVDDLLLEAGGGDGEGVVVGGERVEVVDAAVVGGGGEGAVVVGVGEGEGRVGDDGAGGVGDGALDGGAELGVTRAVVKQGDGRESGEALPAGSACAWMRWWTRNGS